MGELDDIGEFGLGVAPRYDKPINKIEISKAKEEERAKMEADEQATNILQATTSAASKAPSSGAAGGAMKVKAQMNERRGVTCEGQETRVDKFNHLKPPKDATERSEAETAAKKAADEAAAKKAARELCGTWGYEEKAKEGHYIIYDTGADLLFQEGDWTGTIT